MVRSTLVVLIGEDKPHISSVHKNKIPHNGPPLLRTYILYGVQKGVILDNREEKIEKSYGMSRARTGDL